MRQVHIRYTSTHRRQHTHMGCLLVLLVPLVLLLMLCLSPLLVILLAPLILTISSMVMLVLVVALPLVAVTWTLRWLARQGRFGRGLALVLGTALLAFVLIAVVGAILTSSH